MSADPALLARLRAVVRGIEARAPRPASSGAPSPSASAPAARAAPGAPWLVARETAAGPCGYREVRSAVAAPAVDGALLALLAPGERVSAGPLLFLDIETTGLGGAGAIAFVVATARIEAGACVLRQYVARTPAEEAGVLEALCADAAVHEQPTLVTYNGRTFDAPMLDARATLHRRRAGFEALPQLDLLSPVRTMYRGMLPSCRLRDVETHLLGLTRPDDDASGAEAPRWYFQYLRSRDERDVRPVLEHNERDVHSLVVLLARLAALVRDGGAPRTAIDALALGRLFARRGEHARAELALERATALLAPSYARDEALWRLARAYKRRGRRDRAEPLWRELAERRGSLPAHVELAIYYEHHARDVGRAAAATERALGIASALVHGSARVEALAVRRARLRRKHAAASVDV